MANKASFTLPAGVDLSVEGNKLNVKYDGDVSLEQSMGLELGSVSAGGNLHIALERITGALEAGGELTLEGTIDADAITAPSLTLPGGAAVGEITVGDLTCGDLRVKNLTVNGSLTAGVISASGTITVAGEVTAEKISGRIVDLQGKTIKAKAIEASESISIGKSKVQMDVVIAPEIIIDPAATGRITVVESHNERGAGKIKGGLSVNDYDEILGDAADFLRERGVSPLGAAGEAAPVEEPEVDEDAAMTMIPDEPEPEPEPEPELEPELEDEEEDEDPLSVSVDDLEPVGVDIDPAVAEKLEKAMGKIRSLYDGSEVPPAVTQLGDFIDNAQYDELRENITGIWNGLLTYHQKKGIRPHHQVTHAFNVIHGLVQEAT